MTSVFNIHPHDLKNKLYYIKSYNENNLTFLDMIKEKYNIDIHIYYDIVNMNEEFKLKNILYFMNFRLKNIDMKIDYDIVSYDNINEIFIDFIDNKIVNSIIIMNL